MCKFQHKQLQGVFVIWTSLVVFFFFFENQTSLVVDSIKINFFFYDKRQNMLERGETSV